MAFTRLVAVLNTQAMKLLAGSTEIPGVDVITTAQSGGSTNGVLLVLDIDGDSPTRTYKLQVQEGNDLITLLQVTR